MTGATLGLALGIAGLAACYAIARVIVASVPHPSDPDAEPHGDVISVPKVSHPRGDTP